MESLGQTFLDIATTIAFASFMLAFALVVYRLIRGPSFTDRVVALDMLVLISIGFITVQAVVTGEYNYIDVAIAMSLVGFLATVAFARYIYRRACIIDMETAEDVENRTGNPGTSSDPGNGTRGGGVS